MSLPFFDVVRVLTQISAFDFQKSFRHILSIHGIFNVGTLNLETENMFAKTTFDQISIRFQIDAVFGNLTAPGASVHYKYVFA